MKTPLLLALCVAALVALAAAVPARIGSGVNLAGMEFNAGTLPGKAYTNYVLPSHAEVRPSLLRFTLLLVWKFAPAGTASASLGAWTFHIHAYLHSH